MADLTLSRDLSDILDGLARVVIQAIGYREVEDWADLEKGPATQVHQGFQIRWGGDRNTNKFSDNQAHHMVVVNTIDDPEGIDDEIRSLFAAFGS